MPRKSRESLNTSFFHVITQGIEQKYIFEKEIYKRKYFKLLKQFKEEFDIKIIAYCIMENHAHLLVYTNNNTNLSLFMKKVNEDYARYYNFMEERVGYVFRDRFCSEPIYDEKYLKNCLVYIHNNPVKAHITKNCMEYEYSSYKDFLRKKNFINDEIIELVFHATNIKIREYEEMHQKNQYFFMENEDNTEKNVQEIIQEYEEKHHMTYEEIKQNEGLLRIIILDIKKRMKISDNKLSKILNIERHRMKRIYNSRGSNSGRTKVVRNLPKKVRPELERIFQNKSVPIWNKFSF